MEVLDISNNKSLLKPEYYTKFNYQTLGGLGFKSSSQASAAGYVCIRPYYKINSMNHAPGLWVKPEMLPEIKLAISVENSEAARKSHEENQKRHEKKLKYLANNLKINPELLETSQYPGLSKFIRKIQYGDISNTIYEFMMLLNPDYLGYKINKSCMFSLPDGIAVEAGGADAIKHLLEANQIEYNKLIEARIEQIKVKSQALYDKALLTAPDWYKPSGLLFWANNISCGLFSQNQHPLVHVLSDLVKNKKTSVNWRGIPVIGFNFYKPAVYDYVWSLSLADINNKYGNLLEPAANNRAPLHQSVDNLKPLPNQQPAVPSLGHKLRCCFEAKSRETLSAWLDTEYNIWLQTSYSEWCSKTHVNNSEFNKMLVDSFRFVVSSISPSDKIVTYVSADSAVDWLRSRITTRLKFLIDAYEYNYSIEMFKGNELPKTLEDFYPLARSLNRKITFISGPTNSGKTWQALQRLKAVESGCYLGPLRLLALEVRDDLVSQGYSVSLVTGELVELVSGATLTSSTIEMADFETVVDVAVIDEIQMLGDFQRGSAWFEALLGIPAREVVVVGSSVVETTLSAVANRLGETFTVINTARKNPLTVMQYPSSLKALEPHTAIVAFSRRDILGIAADLRAKGHNPAIIYGALPPDVRLEQSRKFQTGEADILVASDAIGMGLNLPIKTLIFAQAYKWDGRSEVYIEPQLLNQIAGRAGRNGFHEEGFVGALNGAALKYIKSHVPLRVKESVPVLRFSMTHSIADKIGVFLETSNLTEIIRFFKQHLIFNKWAAPVSTDDQLSLAKFLDEHVDLSLADKFVLSRSPSLHGSQMLQVFVSAVEAIGTNGVLKIPDYLINFNKDLDGLELAIRELTLYCWLHYRFSTQLPDIDLARQLLAKYSDSINARLEQSHHRHCRRCNGILSWNHQHAICQSCYESRYSYYDNDDYGYRY